MVWRPTRRGLSKNISYWSTSHHIVKFRLLQANTWKLEINFDCYKQARGSWKLIQAKSKKSLHCALVRLWCLSDTPSSLGAVYPLRQALIPAICPHSGAVRSGDLTELGGWQLGKKLTQSHFHQFQFRFDTDRSALVTRRVGSQVQLQL